MENINNRILAWIRLNKKREQQVIFLCKSLSYLTAISYGCIILYTFCFNSSLLFTILAFPSTVFITITILRKIINRPRPYQTLSITPLFQNKIGESMPSRHSASAFAIALAGYLVHPYIGIVLLIIASLIAISRFISGVHYLSDILVAILITFGIHIVFVLFL
jgi:membrane-associated phospholipid phosphatase